MVPLSTLHSNEHSVSTQYMLIITTKHGLTVVIWVAFSVGKSGSH